MQRRYRFGQALAQGGFGTVYAADEILPDGFTRKVAIKVLNDTDEDAQEYAQRLRDEARMLGLVRHRAIVDPVGLVPLRGRWAVIMELVPGVDLAQLVAFGPLPATVCLEIVAECAAALHTAYTTAGPGGRPLRLLHRDLKPGNIRLTADGEVKILDFGAGRAEFQAREAKTEAFTFGSMSYMAPERLDGFDSHAADVFSLGVVLFELLTASAFGRASAAPERYAARLREVMDHLWRTTNGMSEDLVRLVGGMLAYDPAERPDARAVERFCASLSRTLEGPHLRHWAEQAVARGLPKAPQPRDDELTGVEISDTGLEIPAALAHSPPGPVDLGVRSDGQARSAFGAGAVTIPPPELSQLFATDPSSAAIPRGRKAHTIKKPDVTSRVRIKPAEEPSPTGGGRARWLAGASVLALLLGVGAAVAGHLLDSGEQPLVAPAPPTVLSAPTLPLSLSESDDEPPEAQAEAEDTPAESSPRPRKRPKSPEAAPSGRVAITGYAHEVWLLDGDGRKPPGELPVGRYKVLARFTADQPLKTVATVVVQEGLTTRLNCSKVYRTCSVGK